MYKNKLSTIVVLGLSAFSFAQTSQIQFDENAAFRKAKSLYYTETYLAANHAFEGLLDNKKLNAPTQEATEYYAALTGLINNQPGGEERFAVFFEKYPKSIYTEYGAWELGSFYLQKGDFNKAYQYLGKKDLNNIPERKRNEYQFKLGYLHLMKGDNEKALNYLEPLTNSEQYANEANFYVGHLYYDMGDNEKALKYFNDLSQETNAYDSKILPYLVQIAFNNGEYQKAIAQGKQLLAQPQTSFMRSEVSKIIGESYFKLKDFQSAIPYLEQYQGKMSNADYYQLGYAYYEQKQYEKAVSYFNKIVNQKDQWAQVAYYQLGNAYLKTNQKKEALSAYHAASKMAYNKEVQEDAAYYYAKLSYDIGNPYESAIAVLEKFSNQYPHSKYRNEVNKLLVDALISGGDYKNAIQVLGKIKEKNSQTLEAEQLAGFLYGISLFKEGKTAEAKHYLSLAVKSNTTSEVTQRAYFWLGEIAYREGYYQEAIQNFEKFKTYPNRVEESKEIDYQLGYAYLKTKNFSAATKAFERYLATNPPGDFKADAQLRLANSYVGTKNNDSAIKLYDELAKTSTVNADEAAYNKALVLGIKGEVREKAVALEQFIVNYPVSKFNSEAKLDLADAYIQLKETDKATLVLDDLINTALNKDLKLEARIRKGLVYYNQEKNSEALKEFKKVVEEAPRSKIANQAIENIKRIYVSQGDYKGFENWAKSLDFYDVNTADIENLAYDEIMQKFDKKQYKEVIPLLNNFIAQYPKSNYFYAANYALGESLYQTESYEQAVSPFSEVAKYAVDNKEDALLRLAQIYLIQNKETKALLTLENLYKISTNEDYSSYAEIKLMQLYSKKKNYAKALAMAEKVLKNTKNEKAVQQEAKLVKAESLFANGNLKEAKVAYAALENSESNAVKAEALYYKAYFLNSEKQYKKSNEVIFNLASKYAEQQLWGSQALVLMAQNYYQLGDLYQANFTLKTVIDNYQEFPEVVEKAKALQKEINKK